MAQQQARQVVADVIAPLELGIATRLQLQPLYLQLFQSMFVRAWTRILRHAQQHPEEVAEYSGDNPALIAKGVGTVAEMVVVSEILTVSCLTAMCRSLTHGIHALRNFN